MNPGTGTAPKTTTTTPPPVPEHVKQQRIWIAKITKAKIEAEQAEKRQTVQNQVVEEEVGKLEANAEEIREGLTFGMEKLTPSILGRLKEIAGHGPEKMNSLTGTGDAMKEIDTFHDLKELKSISPEDAKKALQALEKVVNASNTTKDKINKQRYEELGWDEKKVAALREAMSKPPEKKKPSLDGKPEKPSQEEQDIEKLKAIDKDTDKTVGREVWTPLVRAGIIPENMVPDKFSDVKQTFQEASKYYQERLQEYSESRDENSDLLDKLGVAKSLLDKSNKFVNAVASALPTEYKTLVTGVSQLVTIVASTTLSVAEQKIKQSDAQDIADTVAGGIGKFAQGLLATAGYPQIGDAVQAGMEAGVAGGRAVRGIVEGNAENVFNALADVVGSALSTAAAATGIEELDTIAPAAIGALKTGGSLAKLKKAMESGDKKAIEAALNEALTNAINTLSTTVQTIVKAEKVKGGGEINKEIEMGATALTGIITASISGDKVKGITVSLGTLANSACSTFIEPKSLGKQIGGLLNKAISGGPDLINGLKNKEPDKVLAFFGGVIVEAVGTGMTAQKLDGQLIKTITGELMNSIATLQEANALKNAVESGSIKDINDAAQALINAVGVHLNTLLPKSGSDDSEDDDSDDSDGTSDVKGSESEDGKKEDQAVIDKLRVKIAENQKVIVEAQKILDNPKATPEEKKEAEAKKKDATEKKGTAIKEIVDQNLMKKELEAETGLFLDKLNVTFGEQNDDPDAEGDSAPKLKEMILQLQKDRKIFELVDKLTDMPIALAAKFFPPAGAALDFKKFSMEVMKAVQHTRALIQWMDNASDARAAVTVQVHAMLSRVGMEKRQLLEHNMRAALALISAVGQVVATVGAHAAPIGVAMTAAAKASEVGLDLAKAGLDELEVSNAWATFKKAIANPGDRKQARMAIESNPTLAKYALAYGALEGGDPIAKNALRKCGLTDAVLSQKDANVKDVQAYLEEMFHEDLVVLRTVPVDKKWHPKQKPAITLRSWTVYLSAAVKDGGLAPGSGGSVSATFVNLDKAEESFAKAQRNLERMKRFQEEQAIKQKKIKGLATKVDPETLTDPTKAPDLTDTKADPVGEMLAKKVERANDGLKTAQGELEKSVTAMRQAVGGFSPRDTSKPPKLHEEMSEYLDTLDALGEVRLRELKGEVIALSKVA